MEGASAAAAARPAAGGDTTRETLMQLREERLVQQRAKRREQEKKEREKLKAVVTGREFDGFSTEAFYGFGQKLGEGAYAKVHLAYHRLAGARVAIKSYEKARLRDRVQYRRVMQEIGIMEGLNHPFVVRLLEQVESNKFLHIVMEYAGGGSLCQHVKRKKKLSEVQTSKLFCQLVLAVEYLHECGLVHRDIKLDNVLFDGRGHVKLVDFGFSTTITEPEKRLKVFCGTPTYMAPELVRRKPYLGPPVDVWALGVVLYACLVGRFPFAAKNYPDLFKLIQTAKLDFPSSMSAEAKVLLRGMMNPDPAARLTVAQVRDHPWLRSAMQAVQQELQEPLDHSLLLSDDPADDLFEALLRKAAECGLERSAVLEAIEERQRNAYSTTYYLMLQRFGRAHVEKVSESMQRKAGQTVTKRASLTSSDVAASSRLLPAASSRRGSMADSSSPSPSPSPTARARPAEVLSPMDAIDSVDRDIEEEQESRRRLRDSRRRHRRLQSFHEASTPVVKLASEPAGVSPSTEGPPVVPAFSRAAAPVASRQRLHSLPTASPRLLPPTSRGSASMEGGVSPAETAAAAAGGGGSPVRIHPLRSISPHGSDLSAGPTFTAPHLDRSMLPTPSKALPGDGGSSTLASPLEPLSSGGPLPARRRRSSQLHLQSLTTIEGGDSTLPSPGPRPAATIAGGGGGDGTPK